MLRTFFILIAGLALLGCSYREEKGRRTFSGASVGFSEVRAQIFTQNCVGCHGGSKPPTLITYEQVKENLGKIQDVVLIRKTMPKRGPLGDTDLAMLERWIADGAPEIGPAPVVPPPGTGGERPVVKWAELKQKVLNGRCIICHFLNNPERISNLDDLEAFRGTIGTSYFLSVVTPAMPPAPKGTPDGDPNPNELSRAEKELLSFWLVDGMQP